MIEVGSVVAGLKVLAVAKVVEVPAEGVAYAVALFGPGLGVVVVDTDAGEVLAAIHYVESVEEGVAYIGEAAEFF